MTIEKLEALERAATAGIWCADADAVVVGEDYTVSENSRVADSELIAAARNALPALLAVAKAAHTYCVLSHAGADTHDAYLELWEALDKLEATP